MKREEKNEKENRIACSLREYMIFRILKRAKNDCVEEHIEIPVSVLQNLVWNTCITSGKKLHNEIIYFKRTPEEYKPVHSVSITLLTSKYIRPALKRINKQVESAILNNDTSDLSFPYKVELISSEDEKLSLYRFSPYREWYTALRLYAHFEKGPREKLSLPKVTFHKLFESDHRNVEWHINEYRNNYNAPLSVVEQLEYTSDYVIPVLNYLNQITQERAKNVKYTLQVDCTTPNRNVHQVTYRFCRQNTPNEAFLSTDSTSAYYYSTKKTRPIFYYQMSKWAYMLHVFLFHMYLQNKFSKAMVTYRESNTINTIMEFDARKVWDFWYLIPHDTNPFWTEEEKKEIEKSENERTNAGKKKTGITSPHTSFYDEFEKASEELNNLYILKIGAGESQKKPKIFLLPDIRSRDEKKADLKKPSMKYNTHYQTDAYPFKIYTTYQSLYHTYKNSATGKYYVQVNTKFFKDIENNQCTSTYPKAYAQFFPKTSYSQMRLLEYLLEALPYTATLGEEKVLSVPMLSIITGKFDTTDYKINKHFANLNLMDQPVKKLFTSYKYHHRFSYLFYNLFIKVTMDKLNNRLKVLGSTTGYKAEFSTDSNQDSEVPFIRFSLVPIDVALIQYEKKDAP